MIDSSENTDVSGEGKLNVRLQILQGLLDSMGDATSAKVNSLRQTIRRNKMDTAQNASKSLDLLRQIVQDDINRELRLVLDRYMNTTFSVAMDNLRRNGISIGIDNVNELCRNILDAAKLPFTPPSPPQLTSNTKFDAYDADGRRVASGIDSTQPVANLPASYLTNKRLHPDLRRFFYRERENESDAESDVSLVNAVGRAPAAFMPNRPRPTLTAARSTVPSIRGRKRGRPRKCDVIDRSSPGRVGTPSSTVNMSAPLSVMEVIKWDPNRIKPDTLFILGAKANKFLGMSQRGRIYFKHPNMFRYVGDNDDKMWLFANSLTTRTGGRAFIMLLDDVLELSRMDEYRTTSDSSASDLQRYAFTVPPHLLAKIRNYMTLTYDSMRAMLPASGVV